jgi:hypothetical protein
MSINALIVLGAHLSGSFRRACVGRLLQLLCDQPHPGREPQDRRRRRAGLQALDPGACDERKAARDS